MIDIQQKKNKILEFLKTSGPSLPVRIAKAIEMDPVFASAILSELLNSKEIITSHMKIGASPLYLLTNQKEELEEKTNNLKPIEKEAQEKLKSKKVIFDEQEEPAIRVALRNIKDFAIPFKFKEKIAWKYAFVSQEEINKILFPKENIIPDKKSNQKPTKEVTEKTTTNPIIKNPPEVSKTWKIEKIERIQPEKDLKKIEKIFEKQEKTKESTNTPQTNKTFLKEIELFLKKQETVITSIEEVDKKKVIATTKSNSKQAMLFAFNKKRISEIELFKCYKYAKKANLPYYIITRDNPTKKMNETIDAYKKLIKVEKLNN